VGFILFKAVNYKSSIRHLKGPHPLTDSSAKYLCLRFTITEQLLSSEPTVKKEEIQYLYRSCLWNTFIAKKISVSDCECLVGASATFRMKIKNILFNSVSRSACMLQSPNYMNDFSKNRRMVDINCGHSLTFVFFF
jgi:hypothetical protein